MTRILRLIQRISKKVYVKKKYLTARLLCSMITQVT